MPGRTGMRKHMAPHPDLSTSRMWKAMRLLRQFTRGEIEATAEVNPLHVGTYVHKLIGSGYVEVVQPEDRGRHIPAVLRLIKNTGPVAPRFGIHGCYDANVEEPLLRPGDRPLTRRAPALMRMLRTVVDRCRSGTVDSELLDQAERLIREAEGRA